MLLVGSTYTPQGQPLVVETLFSPQTHEDEWHEDTVIVSQGAFDSLFTYDMKTYSAETNHYVAVRFLGSDLLSEFRIFKVSGISGPSANHCISVRSSNITNNITVTRALIFAISPIKTDHLLVSVPIKNSFDALQLDKNISYSNLLVQNGQPRLIHKGDKLVLTLNNGNIVSATAISLEPLNQGILHKNSKITVVYDNDYSFQSIGNAKKNTSDQQLLENLAKNSFSFDEYLSLSSKDLEAKSEELSLDVIPLSVKLNNFSPSPSKSEDPEIFAFTGLNNLVKINHFSGDYLNVQFSKDDIIFHKTVKVFAFVEPNNFKDNGFYISPMFYFNADQPTKVNLKTKLDNFQSITQGDKPENHFALAKQVTISRIASPLSLNRTYQQVFLVNLKNFFERTLRVLTRGAIIPIPIDTLLSQSLFASYGDSDYPSVIPMGKPNDVVWFMVTDILPESDEQKVKFNTDQFLINPLKTKMVQSGLVQDFQVPQVTDLLNWRAYLGLQPLFRYLPVLAKKEANSKVFEFAEKLKNLINTALMSNFSSDFQLKTCILLHSLTRNVGKSTVVKSLAAELGINLLELDGFDFFSSPGSEMKTIGILKGKLDLSINNCKSPTIVFFKHLDALVGSNFDGGDNNSEGNNNGGSGNGARKNNFNVKFIEMLQSHFKVNKNIIFIGSTNNVDKIPNDLRNVFNFSVDVTVPNETERQEIFKFCLEVSSQKLFNLYDLITKSLKTRKFSYVLSDEVSISTLSIQSAGLNPIDLVSIVKSARTLALDRYYGMLDIYPTLTLHDLVLSNGGSIILTAEDFEKSINNARNTFSESIGAPKIPNVKWEDVGGLELVKDEILDTIEMPLKNPYLFNNGLKKRSGILFYGPPGTGKTLLAKAIATNFSLNFFSVKGPELLNMYIGESEANVRKVFQKARDARPCVVFFDELDSVAPKRGNQGDSGGVMDRIVSQLLSELDGMSDGNDGDGVFVVGATNRPDLLDEALLRPGRFDKMLYLGISDTHDKQAKILEALTRKFKFSNDVDLGKIVNTLGFNYTGADFYALSSDAMLNAMTRKAREVDTKIKEYNESLNEGQKKINTR